MVAGWSQGMVEIIMDIPSPPTAREIKGKLSPPCPRNRPAPYSALIQNCIGWLTFSLPPISFQLISHSAPSIGA